MGARLETRGPVRTFKLTSKINIKIFQPTNIKRMKYIITSLGFFLLIWNTSQAQYSRVYVKSPSSNTVGISTGTINNTKVIGLSHDGTSGTISTGSLNGGSEYSPLRFLTSNQIRMTILENGNIGIGTPSPSSELTVAGIIEAREVNVSVSAGTGPDYVFASDYRLPTLQETQAYIRQFSHLPEVPPAAVMEKEGINLSEMNMLLLKKIEELTLYAIEQSNKTEELVNQLKQQQEEINALKAQLK